MKMRTTVAAALIAAAIAGIPSAAVAVSASVDDPRYDQTTVKGRPTAALKAQSDLTRLGYWTLNGRLHFRFTFRDLSSGVALPILEVNESRSTGLHYRVWYSPRTGWNTPVLDRYNDNYPVTEVCHGKAGVRIDYAHNYIQMSFPKTCFESGHDLYRPWAHSDFVSWNSAVEIRDRTAGGPTLVPNN